MLITERINRGVPPAGDTIKRKKKIMKKKTTPCTRARARIGEIATRVYRSFSAPGAIAIHCSNTSVTSFLVARDRSGLLLLATLIARTMVFAPRLT